MSLLHVENNELILQREILIFLVETHPYAQGHSSSTGTYSSSRDVLCLIMLGWQFNASKKRPLFLHYTGGKNIPVEFLWNYSHLFTSVDEFVLLYEPFDIQQMKQYRRKGCHCIVICSDSKQMTSWDGRWEISSFVTNDELPFLLIITFQSSFDFPLLLSLHMPHKMRVWCLATHVQLEQYHYLTAI